MIYDFGLKWWYKATKNKNLTQYQANKIKPCHQEKNGLNGDI